MRMLKKAKFFGGLFRRYFIARVIQIAILIKKHGITRAFSIDGIGLALLKLNSKAIRFFC